MTESEISSSNAAISTAKIWRNEELNATDGIIQVVDHPLRSSYFKYRQELRDYPQKPGFPSTGSRPTL